MQEPFAIRNIEGSQIGFQTVAHTLYLGDIANESHWNLLEICAGVDPPVVAISEETLGLATAQNECSFPSKVARMQL